MKVKILCNIVILLISLPLFAGSTPPRPPTETEMEHNKEIQVIDNDHKITKMQLKNQFQTEREHLKNVNELEKMKVESQLERNKIALKFGLLLFSFVFFIIFFISILNKYKDYRIALKDAEYKKDILISAINTGQLSKDDKDYLHSVVSTLKKNNTIKKIN